jgi:hypothetical protein
MRKVNIYIGCPGYVKTGGTEVLHQLFYVINNCDSRDKINLFLFYYNRDSKIEAHPTPPSFEGYIDKNKIVYSIDDDTSNYLIIPEIATHLISIYAKVKILQWWLSVDNFYSNLGFRDFRKLTSKEIVKKLFRRYPFNIVKTVFSEKVYIHLCQSQYAYEHLEKMGLNNKMFLSDFINLDYLSSIQEPNLRNNVILYNPLKGADITSKIIKANSDYKFIPISGLKNDEVIKLMFNSKLYIDFGHHPGKDRLPREAVMCGCCIITNTRGSAENEVDISIDNKYKFNDYYLDNFKLSKLIESIFNDFDSHTNSFSEYRTKITSEKQVFYFEVKSLLQNIL